MPPTISASFQGNAQAFQSSLSSTPILIVAALVAVYIILGMLYENTIHPLTIISTLPAAGAGALAILLVCGFGLDVMGIIGIILLIGIVKKNGIMLVDFALEAERSRGLTAEQSIYEACLLRFRPILMTTMCALLGSLPLMLGTGTGSELRQPLGYAMAGGLVVSQVLTLFTTPVVYIYMDKLAHLRFWRGDGRTSMRPLRPNEPGSSGRLTELRFGATVAAEEAAATMTNWNTFDLNLLVVFDTVMQEKNLTRTGQRLGLTQSAVSHALARLRHMLNDELFVRTPEGMLPTPRAERMVGPIHQALQEMRVVLEADEFEPSQASRTFTMAANNYAARAVIPAFVRHVATVAPSVVVEVRPVGMLHMLDQLDAGAVELALDTLTEGGERFKCVALLEDDYVAILSGDHPLASEPALSMEHIGACPISP